MKIEVAAEILEAERKYLAESAESFEKAFHSKKSNLRTHAEALKLAVSALQKEIPKKIEGVWFDGYLRWEGHQLGNCPCCGASLVKFTAETRCNHCGQKLDWGGAEGDYSGRL